MMKFLILLVSGLLLAGEVFSSPCLSNVNSNVGHNIHKRINEISALIASSASDEEVLLRLYEEQVVCQLVIEDFAGAQSTAESAISTLPANPDMIITLAEIYAFQKKCVNAVAMSKKSILLRPSDIRLMVDAAEIMLECNESISAEDLLTKAVKKGEKIRASYGKDAYFPALDDAIERLETLKPKSQNRK